MTPQHPPDRKERTRYFAFIWRGHYRTRPRSAILSSTPKGPTSPGAAVDGLPLDLVRPRPTPVDEGPSRGPSPPLDAAGIRKAARGWEVRDIDADGWKLLMSSRFAVRGNGRTD